VIDRITQILNARWLINQEVVYNYLPLFLSFLNGKIDFAASSPDPRNKPFVLRAGPSGGINLADQYDLEVGETEPGSIAVIPIRGEIMAWKSMQLVKYMMMSESDPNIIGVVFMVNTPGGMVFYTDIAAAAIKNMQKPTVSYVMNMAASAGMWLISGTKRIVLSSPLDRVGSIGTMASVMDFSRLLKDKLNIDIFEIYADASVNKNQEIRTLLNSKLTLEERTAPIREDLNYVNDFFHQAISANLGIDRASEVFTGKMYNAKRAVELSLAHEINSFEYSVNLAHQMGQINQYIQLNP
jgi:ClpP class serine protease